MGSTSSIFMNHGDCARQRLEAIASRLEAIASRFATLSKATALSPQRFCGLAPEVATDHERSGGPVRNPLKPASVEPGDVHLPRFAEGGVRLTHSGFFGSIHQGSPKHCHVESKKHEHLVFGLVWGNQVLLLQARLLYFSSLQR